MDTTQWRTDYEIRMFRNVLPHEFLCTCTGCTLSKHASKGGSSWNYGHKVEPQLWPSCSISSCPFSALAQTFFGCPFPTQVYKEKSRDAGSSPTHSTCASTMSNTSSTSSCSCCSPQCSVPAFRVHAVHAADCGTGCCRHRQHPGALQ